MGYVRFQDRDNTGGETGIVLLESAVVRLIKWGMRPEVTVQCGQRVGGYKSVFSFRILEGRIFESRRWGIE